MELFVGLVVVPVAFCVGIMIGGIFAVMKNRKMRLHAEMMSKACLVENLRFAVSKSESGRYMTNQRRDYAF